MCEFLNKQLLQMYENLFQIRDKTQKKCYYKNIKC